MITRSLGRDFYLIWTATVLLSISGSAALGQPARGQRPVGQLIEQLNDYVNRLDLDEKQKPAVETLFTAARQKLRELRQNPPGDGTAPQRVQAIVLQLRQDLNQTLTTDQQQRLRDLIAAGDDPAAPPARGRGARGRAMMQEMMQPMAGEMTQGGAPSAAAAQAPAEPQLPAGVQVGQPAPDFTLNNIDGRPVSLASYKGKIVLLVFGSYTSPSFRQRAPGIEQLRNAYGARINVVVIYTKESHAVGDWEVERNKHEGIAIEQPTESADRSAQAKTARTTLGLTAPMLVDTIDNATATAYGGFTNAAILIGRDGTVLARQQWFEPYALRRHIDQALK